VEFVSERVTMSACYVRQSAHMTGASVRWRHYREGS